MQENRPNRIWRRLVELAWQSPTIHRVYVRSFYELYSLLVRGDQRFMNYGYADLKGDRRIPLGAEDELYRNQIQMYHHVASQIDLRGLDVLEVGSGRGGGAAYVAGQLGPSHMTGVDLSRRAVEFCKKRYHVPGLEFVQGDAENLDFPDRNFDAVLNIESSHGYGHIARFFSEVERVLRPGGYFLYADWRTATRMPCLFQEFQTAGLELCQQQNITPSVMQALELDDARKMELIRQRAPRFLQGKLEEFACTKSSENYKRYRTGKKQYISCLLRKPGTGS